MSDDEEYTQADTGSMTFPQSAGDIKKGSHMLIKGFPCKVVEVTTSKTGKHGHAKASITAVDIFTGKKMEDSVPSSHNVDCPNVVKVESQLISIEGNNVTIMLENGDFEDDLCFADTDDQKELKEKMQEALSQDRNLLLVVIKAMGHQQPYSFRDDK
jgi:translation initiation factor 5A